MPQMPQSRGEDAGNTDSGMWLVVRQMGAMLWKNALLKRADWKQTTAEITIPALFMLLLVWIKSLTTVFDSPAASYSCGQTIPWQYEDSLNPATFAESPLLECLQRPPNCTEDKYYRDEGGVFEQIGLEGFFPTVGYMESGDGYPWYGLTVGDDSHIYNDFRSLTGVSANNPSLDLRSLAHRLLAKGQKSVLAIAPAHEEFSSRPKEASSRNAPTPSAHEEFSSQPEESSSRNAPKNWDRVREEEGRRPSFLDGDTEGRLEGGQREGAGAEWLAAKDFAAWLVEELGGPDELLSGAVRLFPSEQAIIDYVRSDDYDVPASSGGAEKQPRTGAPTVDGAATDRDEPWGGATRRGGGREEEERGKIGMAVIFNAVPEEGGAVSWDYTLRLNYTYGVSMFEDQATCLYGGCGLTYKLPSTLVTTSSLERPPTSSHMFGYSYSGFLSIQKAVDEYILSQAAGERVYLNVSMGLFPEQAYRTDQFQEIIASTLGIFYMLAFLYPVSRAVRVLVSEKEGRMKEALRMMGLPDLVYHGSWLITFQAQWVVTNVLILLVVRTSVFRYSNKWLVFLWLEAVSLSVMAFCFLLSTFFSRSKTAATLGSVIFFAAFFPYYYVGDEAMTDVSTKTWASLLAPTCLALSSDTFAAYEGGLVGVQTSNWSQSYEDRLPYVNMVTMLLVDAALYFLLAWYLDKVIPSEFGTPLPWHFPVSVPLGARRVKRDQAAAANLDSINDGDGVNGDDAAGQSSWFWRSARGRSSKRRGQEGIGDTAGDSDLGTPLLPVPRGPRVSREGVPSLGLEGVHQYDQEGGAKVEPVGPQLSRQVLEGRTVSTRGLVKVYGNGKVAVKGLDVDLFEGHISVLLGHNGAGKSTAISMVTGTLPPTKGEAYLRGRELSRDLSGIRRSLGVCFQQNTLFDQLTVLQHLQLFSVVKGVKARDVDDEAARMVSEVGLVEKRHTPASALSGGQKRKLSVALAFIGGSEVVVLDEPTSGMDPFSRRSTWSVLQRQRKGRVILLTTHFMDEADTLGDRIAIMAEGELRCMGSSLFLKGLYGVGYTLTVIAKDEGDDLTFDDTSRQEPSSRNGRGSLMMAAGDGQDKLHSLILRHVPEALVVTSVGKERNYRLPFASASKFVDMFREMDDRREELGVAGYGVSVTTLEEVFLRVGHGSTEPLPDHAGGVEEVIPSARLPSVELLSPTSPNRATSSSNNSTDGSSSSTDGNGKSSTEGNNRRRRGGRGGGGVGIGAGGAMGAGWEEEKEGGERGEDGFLLGGNAIMEHDGQSTVRSSKQLGQPCADAPVSISGSVSGPISGPISGSSGGVNRKEKGMFWVHFKALVAKRATYGMRDKKSLFLQLIVPTLLFLLGLILLRSSRSAFDQPSLLLSPATNFNPSMPANIRNPVPIDAPESPSLARSVADRFDGVSIEGMAVLVPQGGAENDLFAGCAQGASPLVNMSDFLLREADVDEKGASRYGAVVLDGSSRLPATRHLHDDVLDTPGSLVYGVLVNASAVHGAPIFMNLVNSAALQAVVDAGDLRRGERDRNGRVQGQGSHGDADDGYANDGDAGTGGREERAKPSITVRSSPLPRTKREELARQTIDGFTTAIMVVISVCFLPASYAIFVVKERAVKAKHQQIISGVSVGAYWASTFAFDVATYLIPCGAFLGLLYAFNVPSYTENEGAVATALLFLLYGPAVAPFTYCISFVFKSASSAQNMVLFVNFVTGLALMVTSFVLNLVESTKDVNAKLKWVYRLFPGFCLGDGLAQLVLCQDGETCMDLSSLGMGMPKKLTPLSWRITGADIISMLACSVGYLFICFAIEYAKTFPKLVGLIASDPSVADDTDDSSEDEDVAREEERVLHMDGVSGSAGGEVVLRGLRKVFKTKQGPKVAVKRLSFAVARGDCFGFLGINGAGKSTTLGILSGDISPTAGQASIAGHDILTEQNKLRRYIGYCPQDDALLDLLTVQEHLLLYARIKGVSDGLLAGVAGDKRREMDLEPFRDTKACELSGGNKRKLSVAIAMIGHPRVVFLDEPSTGMDPIARRFMWDIISRMTTTDRECSVILTTHSMEEAESLCNKIGIMVNGRLRCLGSTQHLKHRFGRGFEADVKIRPPSGTEAVEILRVLRERGIAPIFGSDIDRARLRGPLEACCAALAGGDQSRAAALEAALHGGSGAFLQDVIGSEGGSLPVRLFIEWYLCEERAADLMTFLQETFQGTELLERPTLFSCRYKIPHQDGMTLADVFGHFEKATAKLGLASYAVGQTTLEQIFNSFAATTDNPEVRLTAKNERDVLSHGS